MGNSKKQLRTLDDTNIKTFMVWPQLAQLTSKLNAPDILHV